MDLRKIQITGGSSYMITLPKDWADSVGIRKNDTVGLQPQPDGSMVIYPGGEQAASMGSVKTIDATGVTDRDFLYRMLVGAYIAGHDSIVLKSDSGLSSMAASTASSFAQTAIGLEIMEENDDSIVIKDLMDQGEMRPAKSVERMKVLVRNMLNDTMDGLERKDVSLLSGMPDRDREVDRIDWLISRQVNIHQKDITISRRMGMDLCEISRCSSISRSLERIGDHSVLLASNLRPLIDDPTSLDAEILATGRDVVSLMVESVGTWSDRDMARANRCIEAGEKLVARSQEISAMADDLTGKPAMAAELIAGSVKRVAEYSMDIAEIAINSTMD
ncbi:MAG: phosphate uptake regulator PhoU [Thermoplasmata archaeon]|nr:phosphate uptake regulator PhoU [Thermoplasmata archaeon]